jgi:branched-chain amino acid aminotransferase
LTKWLRGRIIINLRICMQEAQNASYIYQPPTSSVDLIAECSAKGKLIHKAFTVDEILTQGSFGIVEENKRRLEIMKAKKKHTWRLRRERINCYRAKEGWVVEMRKEEDEREQWKQVKEIRIDPIRDQVNTTVLMRKTDRERKGWNEILAWLEKRGFAVAAQTRPNANGYYAEESIIPDRPDRLPGYRLENRNPIAIRATNLGIQVSSKEPLPPRHKEKGLNAVPVHCMALAQFKDGEWGITHLVPSGDISVQGANTTAIQYGQQAFEGAVAMANFKEMLDSDDAIEVNINNGEVVLFRIEENAKRLQKSCAAIGAPVLPLAQIIDSIKETVMANLAYVPRDGEAKLYIRPYVMGTKGGAGANRAKEYIFAVEVFPFGSYLAGKEASISIEGRLDLHRPDTGADKLAVNYSPGFMEKARAKERESSSGENYSDLLFCNRKGTVEEASSCIAFFLQRDDEGNLILITPKTREDEKNLKMAKKRHILDSITRRSIIEIATRIGISVEVRDIHNNEIPNLIGCFTAGTAAGITRVDTIDIKKNESDENPVTCRFNDKAAIKLTGQLYDLLLDARKGQLQDPRLQDLNEEWTTTYSVKRSQLAH